MRIYNGNMFYAGLTPVVGCEQGGIRPRQEKSKYSSKYAFSDLMVCGECGHPYRRQTWSKYGEKSGVWRCESRLKNGTKNCRYSPTLKEKALYEAVMTAINSVVENQGEFVGAFRENVIWVISNYSTKNVPTEYDEKIETLQGRMFTLIENHAKQGAVMEDFEEQYQEIAAGIRELKLKKLKLVQEQKLGESYGQRVEDVDHCIGKVSCKIGEFDDDLVRRLLESVKVVNGDEIEIQFKSGIVMEQRVACDE